MARIGGRFSLSIGAVAVAFLSIVSSAQSGQPIPGFFGIFGGMINSAIVDSARSEWQSRPLSDYNCLASHGVSADQLASRGIGPDDPRVRQILSQCAFAGPAVPVAPQATAAAQDDSPVYFVANTTPPDAFLALRTDPSSTVGLRIATLPNRSTFQILERRPDGWWRIRTTAGQEGWLLSGNGDKTWVACCMSATGVPVATQPAEGPIAAAPNPDYVVSGLALGAPFTPQSDPAADYACHPSDDFPGFSWCSSHHAETGKSGPNTVWISVFRSANNAAVQIVQAVVPAFFLQGDAEREIQRLSRYFGQQARVIAADLPLGAHAVIAVWGAVSLTAVDSPTMDALRSGEQIHRGLLADFLGDPRKSARLGLPIYSLGGGAGFLWNADYNNSGKGGLRITAVDPSALSPAAVSQPVMPPSPAAQSSAAAPPSIAAPATPSPDDLARRERERADRLERVVTAAKKQLEDTAQFIKDHPQNPSLLEYVDRTAALNAAIGQGDPDDIERKSASLSAELNHDKDYQQFVAALAAARAEQQRVTTAQYLGDAIHHAQDQRAFLIDYVSKNPLAPDVAKLMPLIKQIGPALDKPSLDQLQPLTDQIDLAIREAKLDDAFRAAQAARASQAAQTAAGAKPSEPANTTLPTTEKNRFLLEGDLADVLALYNAGANAPHVALNLRGQFVFADDRANVCLFGANPDGVALTVRSALAPYHLKIITGLDQRCDPQRLDSYDIVATQRGAFLKAAQVDALSLIKQIETGVIRQFALVSAADLAAASAAEHTAIEQISTDVAAGARNGYGVVLLLTGSPNLCVVAPDKREAHALLILKNADKLTFDMHVAPVLAAKSADDAFVGAQKAQCGAVYASAADLKALGEGLARTNIPFTYSSLWISPSEVDNKDAEIAQRRQLEAQQASQRAQRAADETRLEAQRAKDLGATQAAQQAALRAKHDGSAKAAVAAIVADVTSWGEKQRGPVEVDYPAYAAWLAEMKSDHWEIMATDADVQDYGISDFKGRPLDAAFVHVAIRLRNPILGEYKDACFVFGRIADPEFSMTREPIVAACDDEDALKLWQAGHKFQSQWIVGG
jgi:hypothetical protein